MKNDLISRASAIDIVRFECGEWEGLAKTIIKRFEQLPSAQPEPPEECERCMMEHTDEMEKLEAELAMAQPKRGKWQYHSYIPHNKYCPKCKKDSPYNKRWDFCPNCGADMRGKQDDSV